MESKRIKLDGEKEDRISVLPDSLIHHILSLLPSTKQAIRTTVLSKRWENQWTHVPVLIFDSTGMSYENFLKFIGNTLILHDCSKINKFHLKYHYPDKKDPQFFTPKIRFAVRKHVEQLDLSSTNQGYVLPKFLFNNASLVQLRTVNCAFMPNGKVNWGCLTVLIIMANCKLTDQAMDHIVSGSPLLKTLELRNCLEFKNLVIASKSLKRLVLMQFRNTFDIEISCSTLEELKLSGCLNVRNVRLLNLPSSLCATFDFYPPGFVAGSTTDIQEIRRSLSKDILQQVKHVKELTIGWWLTMDLADLASTGCLSSPLLNIKCLSLYSPLLNKDNSRVAYVLGNLLMLEKLVIITVPLLHQHNGHLSRSNDFGENYWDSNATVFNCLVSHLKTIEINGFSKRDDDRKHVLNFVQFLLKNARVLKKMVVLLKDTGTAFPFKVSQELLSLPRCSPYAIIEVLCSNK